MVTITMPKLILSTSARCRFVAVTFLALLLLLSATTAEAGRRNRYLQGETDETVSPSEGSTEESTEGSTVLANNIDEETTPSLRGPPPTPAPEPTTDCLGEFIESSAITKIDLFNSVVSENTLHLPEGELRYENAGTVRDRPVDLVITIESGDYTDITQAWENLGLDPSNMNGRKPDSQFGNINLQTVENKPQSGEGNFQFCFRDKDTNELTKVENFRWSVFDLDERQDDVAKKGIGVKEKMLMDISQVAAYQLYPNESGSEVKVSCEDGTDIPCAQGVRTVFHSSTAGTAKDNPDDPNNMTEQQKERSITFTFQDTDCWTFTYDHYCPVEQDHEKVFPLGYDPELNTNVSDKTKCRGYSGGNFLFSGDAEEIIKDGECITPPPTTAPLPTEAPASSPVADGTSQPTTPPLPTEDPVSSPVADATTKAPTSIPKKCADDVILLHKVGLTEFPFDTGCKTDAVEITSQDIKTVTFDLHQFWTDDDTIDEIYVSYKTDLFEEECVKIENVQGDGFLYETLTVTCNLMAPKAHVQICLRDNHFVPDVDNAPIPKCCHPGEEAEDADKPSVCYVLEISCQTECVSELEEK